MKELMGRGNWNKSVCEILLLRFKDDDLESKLNKGLGGREGGVYKEI